MKIVCWLPRLHGGTGLYRVRMPHELLDAEVVFTDSVRYHDLVGDIFFVSKMNFLSVMPHIERMRHEGIKTIIDYDDYWVLPQDHYLFKSYQTHGTSHILSDSLRLFDYVTTTTDLLASEIRRINPNVHVFENAVDTSRKQFDIDTIPSDLIRFGWIGGHCHLPDIELLEGTPEKLMAYSKKWKINLFGHDGRPESIYNLFADVLCGNGKTLDHLGIYRAATVDTYTKFYNLIDVALVPLVDNKFNSMKSELKMVEAAFFKKGLIVSNVMPYRKWITDKNCLRVDNKQDWFKNMKRMLNNPAMIQDMGEQLYSDLHERFDIRTVNKRRMEFYESIVK